MTGLSRWLRALPRRGLLVAASAGLALLPAGLLAQDAPAIDPAVFERLDADKDGVVSGDEVKEEAQGIFKRLLRSADADSDGKLTKAEFEAGMQKAGPTSETPGFGRARRPGSSDGPNPEMAPPGGFRPGGPLMSALDGDDDGELSAAEIAAAVEVLKKLDKNGDGKLTRDELGPPRGPGGNPPGGPGTPGLAGTTGGLVAGLLRRADKNGDGKLSKEEAPERLRDRFEMVDANKDGQIDREEAAASIDRLREVLGPPGGGGAGSPFGGRRPGGSPPRSEAKPETK